VKTIASCIRLGIRSERNTFPILFEKKKRKMTNKIK
jgi:hypothetical protein